MHFKIFNPLQNDKIYDESKLVVVEDEEKKK